MIPFEIGLAAGPWAVVFGLIAATFVNEDLACIAAGLLLAAGKIEWWPALAGCFLGIVLGDFGVWLLGRAAGTRAMRWNWVRKVLTPERLAKLSEQLCEHGGRTAFVARGLPGTRVPLFLAAGILGYCPARFLSWALLAAVLWTPALIFAVVLAGDSILERGWPAVMAVGLGWIFVPMLVSPIGRAKLFARISKLWRWEFWPAWAFYLPLVPWFLLLAIRYRSLTVWTTANPGIVPAGGVVGESKAAILAKLPADRIVPTILVPPGDIGDRVRLVRESGWEFPLILKPDVGERGTGVRKAHDLVDVEKYLIESPGPVIVQPFHPGPFEAGVFYYRLPGEDRGHIFSITDKVFPVAIGDGRSTLEELIWSHPRHRMQAKVFLIRHAEQLGRVLADGERFALATAGNHCQGTLFRDGTHLATPELDTAFDTLARRFDGFFVGRFDVRYSDETAFRAGHGFAIVELNGVASESTNLYDPAWPLWRAYRTLFRQWALLFRIGDANRRRGHRPATVLELLGLVRSHRRRRNAGPA
jgi:membrane protein DedA with SNARE-associated domain